MSSCYNVLIMGASYGSLLVLKIAAAGHAVTLGCRPEEVEVINANGIRVRLPISGKKELVELNSRELPGTVTANVPTATNAKNYDLVVLGM